MDKKKYKRSILIDMETKEDLEKLAIIYDTKLSKLINIALNDFIAKNYDLLKMLKDKDSFE